MKKIFNISIFIIFNLFFSYTSFGNENQSKCISLYSSNNEYDWLKALPYCLKSPKGNEHKIGELYRFKNNCKESVRWFKKSNSVSSYIAIGYNYYWTMGKCKRDKQKALKYFEKANSMVMYCPKYDNKNQKCAVKKKIDNLGNFVANYYIADIIIDQSNPKVPDRIAFQFLLNSVANASHIMDEREKTYFKFVRIYLDDYFKQNLEQYGRKLDEFDVVKVAATFNEPTFYYHTGSLSEQWLNSNFEILLKNVGSSVKALIELVENKKMTTLKAKMMEMGIGEIQDLKNAYRLYLFMAKEGDRYAANWRDDLRDKLTGDEIAEAQCLAKKTKKDKDGYIINPTRFDRVICKF